jgi:hypothetical protein
VAGWRAPAHHSRFAFGACVAYHERWIVGKYAGHRRQVADVAVDHADSVMIAAWLVVIE